jgi:probable F420-dependent oxidoreductase
MGLRVGVVLRNMGPPPPAATLAAAARAADAAEGVSDVWVNDHLAIPPDQAEGSGGRYLEPLATLAFLAAITKRVGLGTAVLVLPYRPPLLTAKWVATVQELSGSRLLLGVGTGWMEAEFRALGADVRRRGATTDATLAFLDRCFAADVVEAEGQPFLFLPRPPRPPVFVGGRPPYAFRRALAHRAGWFPVGITPEVLRPLADRLREAAASAGVAAPEIAVLASLPLEDGAAAGDLLAAYAEAGASRVVHGGRYADLAEFDAMLTRMLRATGR